MTTGFGLAHYQQVADALNTEVLRLRAVNTKLLEALEHYAQGYRTPDLARAAIKAAKRDA